MAVGGTVWASNPNQPEILWFYELILWIQNIEVTQRLSIIQALWKIKPTLESICWVFGLPQCQCSSGNWGFQHGFSCQDLARAHKTPTNGNGPCFGCRTHVYRTSVCPVSHRILEGTVSRMHTLQCKELRQHFCQSRNECAVLRDWLKYCPDKWHYPIIPHSEGNKSHTESSPRGCEHLSLWRKLFTKSSISGDKSLSGRGDKAATGEECNCRFNTQLPLETEKTEISMFLQKYLD